FVSGQRRRFVVRGRKTSWFLGWHGVEILGWVEQMIEQQPEAPRMVEKQQREDHRERDPDRELLVNRHAGEGIQNEKAGNCDRHSRCIININRAYEIALLSFELQAALKTMDVHE